MFCSNCGKEIGNESKCPYCGKEQGQKAAGMPQGGPAPQGGTAPQGGPVPQKGFASQDGTAPQGNPMPQGGQAYYGTGYVDPYDHTGEFTKEDISKNKVIAMVAYLLGTVGIIIALLAAKESPYAGFHVRQALKLTILNFLLGVIALLLCWTIIVPIAALIAFIVLFVVRIICFFSVCVGNAKDPVIVRSFGFLN